MTSTSRQPRSQQGTSLNRKLIGLLLAVGIFPLLAVAAIINVRSSATLTRQVQAQLDELAASSSEKLDRTLASRYADTQAFASSDAARAMDSYRLRAFMARMTQTYAPYYRLMLVADRHGRIIAASQSQPDGQFLDGASLLDGPVVGEAWFEVWRKRDIVAGITYVEDVHPDRRVARLYGDAGYVIGFSHGIYDHTGTWVGVWLNLFDWNTAERILREFEQEFEQRPHEHSAPDLKLMIVNQDGYVLAGAGQDNVLQTRYDKLPRDDVIEGRAKTGGYGKFEGLDWTIMATQSRDQALLVARLLTTQTLILAAISAVLVAIVGILAARTITQPVRALRAAAERVTAGQLDVQVPAGDDELGQLGTAFNCMTAQLRSLYTSLEEKVAQRTAQLESTLADLRRSKAELERWQAQLAETNQTLARSEARYRQLFEQTQAVLTETQVLYRTASSLIRSESLPHLLQAVVDGAVEALPADAVYLVTFDGETKQVTNFVTGGPGADRIRPISYAELWDGLSGWVLSEMQPALSVKGTPDPRESPQALHARAQLNYGSMIVVPLNYREEKLGTMTAINRLDQQDFSQREVALLAAMASQATIAIENARLLADAQRRAYEAETLREVGAVVAATLSQDEAIERILAELSRVVPYDTASVQLLHDGYLEIVGGDGWPDPATIVGMRIPIPGDNPNTIVIRQRQPCMLDDAPRFYPLFSDEQYAKTSIRSWLGIPLIVQDQLIGMLTVDKREPGFFTMDHARLVTAFADHVAIAIENARLYTSAQQELSERRRIEAELRRYQEHLEEQVEERTRELTQLAAQLSEKNEHLHEGIRIAREIQLGLLPDQVPWDTRRLAIRARSIPALEVGGDFYAFIPSQDKSQATIAIGDISGKGVSAALMMALVTSAIETQRRDVIEPSELLSLLNTQLASRLRANRMNAGLLVVKFDCAQRLLIVANAGMIPPILLRQGQVQFIEAYGLPLGSLAVADYQELQVRLQPGDLVMLLSDGAVEAHNGSQELFGFERLVTLLSRYQPTTELDRLIDEIISQIGAFTGSAEQHDDITLIAIRPNLDLF